VIEEALEIGKRISSPLSLTQALTLGAVVRMLSREWEAAASLAAEVRETGDRFGASTHMAGALVVAGIAEGATTDPFRGSEISRKALASLRQAGWETIVPLFLAQLAATLATASETAEAALKMVRMNGELIWEAEVLRVLGEVKRAAGADQAEIEADLRAAVEVARRQGAKSFELRAAASLARFWAGRGDSRKAHELLTPTYGWFTEGFGTPDLREARALLDELRC
jgi:predicted ATPase